MLKTILRWIAYGGVGFGLTALVILATSVYNPSDIESSMIKWGNSPIMTDEWYDMASEYDEIFLSPGAWEGRREHQAQLVKRNPEVLFGTYFSLHTCPYWMERGAEGTYAKTLWNFLSQHLVYTDQGDTASIWKSQPVYNLLDPYVRSGAAAILAAYCKESDVGTVFLDYATTPLVRYDSKPDNVIGELDFDGDGIQHSVDEDEIEALRLAYYEYIGTLRELLPQNTRLIVNGRLAIIEPEFSALFNEHGGICLEDFPHYFWGSVDANWDNALNPEYPNNLHDLNNRAMIYLSDKSNRSRVIETASEYGAVYLPIK